MRYTDKVTVLYDGYCLFCKRTKTIITYLDWFHRIRFINIYDTTAILESNKILQWALGAVTFTYFLVFLNWINLSTFTKEAWESLTYVCPPYFQSCGFMYVLEALPFGYSQTILYMVFCHISAILF